MADGRDGPEGGRQESASVGVGVGEGEGIGRDASLLTGLGVVHDRLMYNGGDLQLLF